MGRHEKSKNLSRRAFLASTALAPLILSSCARGRPGHPGPNDRVRVGYIGVGRRARSLMKLPPDGEIVAYSDPNMNRLEELKAKNPSANIYQDYREMLASDEVDAVVVATPDHWHALPVIHACEAGKDAYVEKPLSLTVTEGRAMVKAARKHKRIVQCGSQRRSMPVCQDGCNLLQEGKIGKIHTVHGANYPSPWDRDLPEEPVPDGIDWDMWCGQTEPQPYHTDLYLPRAQGREYPDGRPYGWISYTPYSGGEMTGWGAHGLDIIQWALGRSQSNPVEVWPELDTDPTGPIVFQGQPIDPKRWPEGKALTCPVTFRYDDGTTVYLDGKGPGGGAIFEGDAGKMMIDGTQYVLQAGDEKKIEKGSDPTTTHLQNWLDCIRSRQRPNADVEIAHRSATFCHLGNIARRTRRKLQWDPARERFVNDPEANTYLSRTMREPWQIK